MVNGDDIPIGVIGLPDNARDVIDIRIGDCFNEADLYSWCIPKP